MKRLYAIGAGCLVSLTALPLMPLATTPAAAAIVCQDDFQKVSGNWIATPYCSDRHIARFARNEGKDVTGRDVRENSQLRNEICKGSSGLEASCGMGGDYE
jgi:hypothetical protein